METCVLGSLGWPGKRECAPECEREARLAEGALLPLSDGVGGGPGKNGSRPPARARERVAVTIPFTRGWVGGSVQRS